MTLIDVKGQDPSVRRKYHTLDGIRGVAAIVIVMRHAGYYFGDFGLHVSKAESYLAVDLFFVLSGFVIAEAYDKRLTGGLSAIEFMKIRLIRLYPLYLLGLLIGTIVVLGSLFFGNNIDHKSGFQVMKDFIFAFLILPTPFSNELYPFSGPSWSLFFELIANGLYAIFRNFLTTSRMILIIGVAAITLGLSVFHYGDMDKGNEWTGFLTAFFRVIYSFGVGLLIHRFHTKLPAFRLPSWSLLGLVFVLLVVVPSTQVRPWYDLFVVILLFPAIVHVASASESSSERMVRVYGLLGTTSYAVYILHKQFALFVAAAFDRVFKHNVEQFAPFSGVVFLIGLVYACWLMDRVYDLPVRRWASQIFLKNRKI
jgi:peptidoglycan/LPS O-acetylase OafA/YrhL